MSEKFCLKWHDFHNNVTTSFSRLRSEEYLHDVTLVTDDNLQVNAHKLVLSASSEYFQTIFSKNKDSKLLLCLDGVSRQDLENCLDYVYNGEVQKRCLNINEGEFRRALGAQAFSGAIINVAELLIFF